MCSFTFFMQRLLTNYRKGKRKKKWRKKPLLPPCFAPALLGSAEPLPWSREDLPSPALDMGALTFPSPWASLGTEISLHTLPGAAPAPCLSSTFLPSPWPSCLLSAPLGREQVPPWALLKPLGWWGWKWGFLREAYGCKLWTEIKA